MSEKVVLSSFLGLTEEQLGQLPEAFDIEIPCTLMENLGSEAWERVRTLRWMTGKLLSLGYRYDVARVPSASSFDDFFRYQFKKTAPATLPRPKADPDSIDI